MGEFRVQAARLLPRPLLVVIALAGGCSDGSPRPTAATVPTTLAATSTTGTGCAPVASGAAEPAPEGALLPPGAVVTKVAPDGPTTLVEGRVATDPVALRAYYAGSGLRVLLIEDEVTEMETLVSDGRFRTFLKASAACGGGSTFVAVVAPEL